MFCGECNKRPRLTCLMAGLCSTWNHIRSGKSSFYDTLVVCLSWFPLKRSFLLRPFNIRGRIGFKMTRLFLGERKGRVIIIYKRLQVKLSADLARSRNRKIDVRLIRVFIRHFLVDFR